MNDKLSTNVVIMILLLSIVSGVRAEYVIDDFESYADPNDPKILSVWSERNPDVAEITLTVDDSNDFQQVMNYEYWCGTSPYWTEAYTIFDTDEDWSMYDTFSMWVKGKTTSQSLENMYVVIYKGKVANPVDHDDLEMLGKAPFYYVTQKPDWTYWRADIDFDFESLASVRALGLGMSPQSNGGYGHGIIQIDELAVDYTELGGVIDNFELYTDTIDLQALVPTFGNCTITLVDDDPNVFDGDHAIKVEYDNSQSPWWAKIMYPWDNFIRHLGNNNWNAAGYTTLTINYKITDPDGYLRVSLFDRFLDDPVASYAYEPNFMPAGDWSRWDIDLRSVLATDPAALDDVRRVDIQFMAHPEYGYGHGEIYLDNIYVNKCGTGKYGVGGLSSNFYDGDCVINLLDFAIAAENWGDTIGIEEIAIMANEWLECNLLYRDDCF